MSKETFLLNNEVQRSADRRIRIAGVLVALLGLIGTITIALS